MIHLPTLPPAFLERCLALSEQLNTMKSGAAKLEVSPSHFLFSLNQHPGNKETGSTFPIKPHHIKRKKTPSDLRRNARRMAEHLKNKNIAKNSTTSSPENPEPSTLIHPTSKEDSISTKNPEDNSPGESPETADKPPSSNDTPSENEVQMDVEKLVLEHVSDVNPENTDLPDTNMEVEEQIPLSPQNVTEDQENIEEEISEDEFSEEETIREKITIGDWPEDLSKAIKNSNTSLDVTVIVCANEFKSAIASLKRTFKKCNLRDIEPRKLEHVPVKVEGSVNSFAFEFTIILKHLKAIFGNMKKNWITIDESQLIGFLAKGFLFQNT